MKRTILSVVALLATAGMSMADNGPNAGPIIGRDSRIDGCIAKVQKVRDGLQTPTEWMLENQEEFEDLQIALKKRRYKPEAAKEMMMGMAINICMQRKGYYNKCAVDADTDTADGDLQSMQTAGIYACWTKGRRADRPPSTPTEPSRPIPQQPRGPDFSPADLAMLNEDLAIVTQNVIIVGDHENGAKEARLSQCGGYWNDRIHYNRPQDVRNILWAVRVWRCMFRTNYTVFTQRCPGVTLVAAQGWGPALHELQRPFCYARFG
jgi:hypothetical protein